MLKFSIGMLIALPVVFLTLANIEVTGSTFFEYFAYFLVGAGVGSFSFAIVDAVAETASEH